MRLKVRKSTGLEEIIQGCRLRKATAQRELFNRYSSRLLGIIRRYVGSIGEAEDILINGFMKIFERIDQYSGEGSFEGWVTRIMVNESLTFIRKNKNMSIEVSLEKAEKHPDYSFAQERLQAEQLLSMIDDLPVGYRTVFNLYVMEGYSHNEISEMLQISEGASKSQLSRAKACLRKQIALLEMEMKRKSHEK